MEKFFTRKGECIKLEKGVGTITDPFGNFIEKQVKVLGFVNKPYFLKSFAVEYIPGKGIIFGKYGLNGGGNCVKCFSANSKPNTINQIKSRMALQGKGAQSQKQFEISEHIESLLNACQKSVMENIVISLKFLADLEISEFLSPVQAAISLLKCLEMEGIWEQITWSQIRKKIAGLARKLLLHSFNKAKDKVQMFSDTKDKVLPIVNGINDRIVEEEANFPENGLLCEIKAVVAIIKAMKDSERWYKSLVRHGKDLVEIVFNYDLASLENILTDFKEFLIAKVNNQMSIHLFCLDFIARQDIQVRVDYLSLLLQDCSTSKWQILYPIIEEIEAVLLSSATPLQKKLLFVGNPPKTIGLKSLAGFNSYLITNNWRIREKIAVILIRIANIPELKAETEDIIADRIVFETDTRVKDILSDPGIVEASHALIETCWERKKERFERILDEEKAILLRLENDFHSKSKTDQDKMFESLQDQRKSFEKQLDELTHITAVLGKATDFLEKYETFTLNFQNSILSAIQESQLILQRNIDRKFSDVMHKLVCKSPRNNLISLYWMPNSSNFFIGREEELGKMQNYLEKFKRKTCMLAIVGIGGIGKTQLALEFANLHQEYFGAMWFINAESRSKIEASFIEMADSLQVDLELKPREIIRKVLIYLGKQTVPWLLIFDGVVNSKDLDFFVPHGRGIMLITSRNSCWDISVNLQGLDRKSSLALLQNMTSLDTDGNECAELLAEELGDLPLALTQAAGFIKQTNSDYDEYYNLFKNRASSIIDLNDNTDTLASSWNINLEQIKEENKSCRLWLECLAYLSPNRIPDKLAKEIFNQIEKKDNILNYKKIIKLAMAYSLIEVDEKHCINMHKLVQNYIRKISQKDRKIPEVLENVFLNMFTTEQELEMTKSLANHLQFYLSVHKSSSSECGELFSRLGIYFLEIMKNIELASSYIHTALKIKVEKHGKTSLEAAQAYNNLGNVFFERSELKQAIFYYTKALQIKQRHLSSTALEVAYSYNNLGICYFHEPNMKEAVVYILKAMEIMKMHLGQNDISITTTYMNLGMAYDEMGQYDNAEKYLDLALKVRSKHLPEKHQDIADCLLNLGILHMKTNTKEKAAGEIKKACEILQECLGPENIITKNAKEHLEKLVNQE